MLKPSLTLQYFVKFFITYIFLNQLGNAVRNLKLVYYFNRKTVPEKKIWQCSKSGSNEGTSTKKYGEDSTAKDYYSIKKFSMGISIWKLKSYVGKQITEDF